MEYNPDFPYFEPPYCVSMFMANSRARAHGSQGDPRTPPNPDADQPTRSVGRGPTRAEDLTEALNTLDESLLILIMAENQEAWKRRVYELRHRVTNIRKEINVEAAWLAERENRLAQEVIRLQQESEMI